MRMYARMSVGFAGMPALLVLHYYHPFSSLVKNKYFVANFGNFCDANYIEPAVDNVALHEICPLHS